MACEHDAISAELESLPLVLTVEEAARLLRISRSFAYEIANRYLASGGVEGLPVLRVGGTSLRVPRWALVELLTTGTVVQIAAGRELRAVGPRRAR